MGRARQIAVSLTIGDDRAMEPASSDGTFPAVYSLLSTAALASRVLGAYPLAEPVTCRLLYVGVNDTYLVDTGDDRYVLRVYRAGWRTRAEIEYELDLIAHLDREGIAVARPVARRDGALVQEVRAPEGVRQVVLFRYVAGVEPGLGEEDGMLFGATLARIHAAAARFSSRHERAPVAFHGMLDRPLAAVAPAPARRPDLWADLLASSDRLRAALRAWPDGALSLGVLHGDYQPKNARLVERQDGEGGPRVTILDFDHCGPGWCAYDLAVYRHAALRREGGETAWRAFLRGYTGARALNEADLAAIPILDSVIRVQTLGFYAAHRDNTLWGSDAMNDGFFERGIAALRAWCSGEGRETRTV
jgi:Ser/Thr protein kinase RdoA (MazF antagonist)